MEFTLVYRIDERNPVQGTFIRGHEEGHICQLTGNLFALYREARRLGCPLDFFTEDYAKSADERVRAVLDTRPREIFEFGVASLVEIDYIADVAGVIALKKSGFNEELVRRVEFEIRSAGFFRTMPQFLREFVRHNIPEKLTPYTASPTNRSL